MKIKFFPLISITSSLALLPTIASAQANTSVLPIRLKDNIEIVVPEKSGGFYIGGNIAYLKPTPSNGDLDYAVLNVPINDLPDPMISTSKIIELKPGYNWEGGTTLGYIFPNTGNDVSLTYFYFDSSGHNITSVPFTNSLLTATLNVLPINIRDFANIFSLETFSVFSAGQAFYTLKQFDLLFGQYINIGNRLTFHSSAGIRGVKLDRTINSLFVAIDPPSLPGAVWMRDISDSKGLGPLFNIDANYYLGYGFGIVSHFDSAITVTKTDVNTNLFFITGGNNSHPENFTFYQHDKYLLSPIYDLKLAADYTYCFNNDSTHLTLEAGWQTNHYYNYVNRYKKIATFFNIIQSTTSDLSLNGPYVSLTLHI